MSSSNQKDGEEPTVYQVHNQRQSRSGMRPSIITTINNTSPTPLVDEAPFSIGNSGNSNNNNNNGVENKGSSNPKSRRTVEPYESYIEDSFVGHWEREDDDLDDEYRTKSGHGDSGDPEEDDSALQHPSTIEFDFDSFGPESFIYTPAAIKHASSDKNPVEETAAESATKQAGTESAERQQTSPEPLRPETSSPVSPAVKEGPRPAITYTSMPDSLVDSTQIDFKVIEPYKKVLSHAGYCHHLDPSAPAPKPGEPAPAIIVFSACYLPDRSRRDYNYVMDHLFLYVLSSLHELIADDYILIYLHNTQPSPQSGSSSTRSQGNSVTNVPSTSVSSEENKTQANNNLPTFTWMKRCYQMIDRKLRKNLKIMYLVKPTFWLKTIVIMCKPFISSKFSRKLRFVETMDDLKRCLPVDKLILPASAENI